VHKFSTIFLLLKLFTIQISAQNSPQFIDLGLGGAAKISNNGVYVVGNNYPAPAWIWTEATGISNLNQINYSEAFGVSDYGLVAGSFIDSNLIAPNGNPTLRAGINQNGIWDSLPGYPGYPVLDEMSYNYGYGISADGSIIVGMQWLPIWKAEACYWDNSGIHLLGRTGGLSSRANDIATTQSGYIIVGWDGSITGPDRRAFYWDPQPHFMGGYDPNYPAGQCEGLNSDGSKIVGGSTGAPFVWTEANGMEWITLDYLNNASYAKDISDNNIIIGYVSPSVGNFNAFIKKPEWNDILFLKDYMIDSLGIQGISDWYFAFANSISADGSRIVETAYPPQSGTSHAFLLQLPDPVPVELISFSANFINNSVELNWTTATEKNNQGFEVERKISNSEWSKIGFVSGNGTTTEQRAYSFTDKYIAANKYFYRLKQIDYDGSVDYSNLVEIDTKPFNDYSLNQNYPNPFNPSTNIEFNIPEQALVNLSVYNLLGEKVATIVNEIMESGNHKIVFDASTLASGVYLVKMTSENFSNQIKINLLK